MKRLKIRPGWKLLSLWLPLLLMPLAARSESYTCVSFDYPPLVFQNAEGAKSGMALEAVQHVFSALGHSVQIVMYPWARALAMVQQGEADCIFTLYRTEARTQFLDFVEAPVATQVVYLYARKGLNLPFHGDIGTLRSVPGLRVGTALKVNYGPRFEQVRAQLTIDEAPTIEQNFQKLALGRIDVLPSNFATAQYMLDRPALASSAASIERLPDPVDSVPSFVAFSKARKLSGLRDAFDAEMRRFALSDEYRRLLVKYRMQAVGAAELAAR